MNSNDSITCPKDREHEVVENEVFGKKFFYCRGCKDEITQQAPEPKKDDYPWWTGMQAYVSSVAQKAASQQQHALYGMLTQDACGNDDCDLCNNIFGDDSNDEGVL